MTLKYSFPSAVVGRYLIFLGYYINIPLYEYNSIKCEYEYQT